MMARNASKRQADGSGGFRGLFSQHNSQNGDNAVVTEEVNRSDGIIDETEVVNEADKDTFINDEKEINPQIVMDEDSSPPSNLNELMEAAGLQLANHVQWRNVKVSSMVTNTIPTFVDSDEFLSDHRSQFRKDLVLGSVATDALRSLAADIPFPIFVTGARFKGVHTQIKPMSINIDVRVMSDVSYRSVTGLHKACASNILDNAASLCDTLLLAILAASRLKTGLHLYCTSGRHRSVALGDWLADYLGIGVVFLTLPDAAPQFKGVFESAAELSRSWLSSFSVCGESRIPVLCGDSREDAKQLGIRLLGAADALEGTSKKARKRARDASMRYVEFTSWNIPVNATFDMIKPDVIADNAMSMIDYDLWFSEVRIPQDFLKCDSSTFCVVDGSLGEQLKHLQFYQRDDDTNESTFESLRADLEEITSEFVEHVEPVYLDPASINTASSAGYEFALAGFVRKGECVPVILRRAMDRIEYLRSGEYVQPGHQNPGGRGKRMLSTKLDSATTSDALGRLIRVAAPCDVALMSSCLNSISMKDDGPTALGFSFFGNVKQHVTALRLYDPEEGAWQNVAVCCPDFKKMDSSVFKGLSMLVLTILFSYFPAMLFLEVGGGIGAPVMLQYFIAVMFDALLVIPTLGICTTIGTGLSSGNTFVSLLESLISASVARRVQRTLQEKCGCTWSCYEKTLGDDIIFTAGVQECYCPLPIIEEVLQNEVERYGLVLHPFSKKGVLGYGPLRYHFLSRILLGANLTSRSLDDTLGGISNPERPTSCLAHCVLRLVGIACDAGLSPALGPLVLAISSAIRFMREERKTLTFEDWEEVKIRSNRAQFVWTALDAAGVTAHQILPLLTECDVRTIPVVLILSILNLHAFGDFAVPSACNRTVSTLEESILEGYLGWSVKTVLWNKRQIQAAEHITALLLKEAGMVEVPSIVLTVRRDDYEGRFEDAGDGPGLASSDQTGIGRRRPACGSLTVVHSCSQEDIIDDEIIFNRLRELVDDTSSKRNATG
jgi:hypothetical protein